MWLYPLLLGKKGIETDIKTSFLQGENINYELFVLPPKKDKIRPLQKYPYGLANTSKK